MLVGNMLSDGGDEFLGREDLGVLLVASVGHGRPVEHFAGILEIGRRETGIPDRSPGQAFFSEKAFRRIYSASAFCPSRSSPAI